MEYTLSIHAETVIHERSLSIDDIEYVLNNPQLIQDDTNDSELQHRLGIIEHYDNRVLRVIINVTKEPVFVVTAYFDRTMKGKL